MNDIRDNFLRYEGKVVTLVGFLRGSHIGTFIESSDDTALIRIRFAEDLQGKRVRPVRDALYSQFESAANSMYAPAIQPEPRASIEVRGFVSVLRHQGRVAKSFNPYTEAPVEFVPIQVRRFKSVPRLPLGVDLLEPPPDLASPAINRPILPETVLFSPEPSPPSRPNH